MIKRPWQIWTIYTLCVMLVVPAMVWLTYTTWRLDEARENDRKETEIARRNAELQERVSSALWRMDWLMIPLVGQEAARPYYMYRSFYSEGLSPIDGDKESSAPVRPSPLLTQPSEFILLHFQIGPDGTYGSPQLPEGKLREMAFACKIPAESIGFNEQQLNLLKQKLSYNSLSVSCSTDKLPSVDRPEFPWQSNEIASQVSRNMAAPKQELLGNRASAAQAIQQQSQTVTNAESDEVQLASPIGDAQKRRSDERGTQEYLQRDKATQSFAKGQQNIFRSGDIEEVTKQPPTVSEGVMRPLWVDDLLILARRVELGDKVVIQGCWLNWEKIKLTLAGEIAEVLPGANMQPVRESEASSPSRQMATLPVQLVDVEKCLATIGIVSADSRAANSVSGLKLSLVIAWVGLVLGLAAIAVLLRGVIRLSERRADFASAVTHELRTPLTTFRMYAEMLAEGMVPSPEKQRQYARTMKIEADRLGHLVENVLRFARLERRTVATRAVSSTIATLFERFQNRLIERAGQAGMTVSIEIDDATRRSSISTDPGTVEQIVFNLIDNACKYAASATDKTIHLIVQSNSSHASSFPSSPQASRLTPHAYLSITVRDHGPGIDAGMSKRLFTAFSKSDQDAAETARGVGLGLALCRRMAADLGGRLVWDKSHTPGASFTLTLPGTPS